MTDDFTPWLLTSGEAVLAQAKLAVDTITEGDIAAYPSLGPPVAELCDRLTIHLVTLGPNASSQKVMNETSGCAPGLSPILVGAWEVQLWRNCYPGLSVANGRITVPSLAALEQMSSGMYAQGQALYAGLVAGYTGGFPEMPACASKVLIGALAPLPPQGTAVGWRVPLTIEYG